MRRLIINADDFGLTVGVNRGIVEAHQLGVVTSTTLMACGKKFAEAVSLAQRAPKLSVGCHVVLVDGTPALSPENVSSLLSANQPTAFRQNLVSFACLAGAGRLDEGQIAAEIAAQVTKLQAAAVQVSHLDSHKHTHMFPVVLRGMLRAAKDCGIRAIRNPFEPLIFASLRHWKRQFQLKLLQSFRSRFREMLAGANVTAPDGCIGMAATGGLTLPILANLLQRLPEGTWEFVSHPGYNDSELSSVKTRLRKSREKELAILTSPEVKDLVRREGIRLISYREL